MFSPISMEEYIANFIKNNPGEKASDIRAALTEAVQAKKDGAKCTNCDSPIWAIGTATAGWNACFSCITGEADNSDDYEIDSVCF